MTDRIAQMRACLAALQPEQLDITDDSARHAGHAGAASGGHYRLTIVSPLFIGKPPVERHRMVYSALHQMQPGVHALSIRALAPGEA